MKNITYYVDNGPRSWDESNSEDYLSLLSTPLAETVVGAGMGFFTLEEAIEVINDELETMMRNDGEPSIRLSFVPIPSLPEICPKARNGTLCFLHREGETEPFHWYIFGPPMQRTGRPGSKPMFLSRPWEGESWDNFTTRFKTALGINPQPSSRDDPQISGE